MTREQIALVQSSFEKIAPIASTAAELFYQRLFQTTPDVIGLFKNSMEDQGRKLIATLGVVVRSLDQLEVIIPAARTLAIRHVTYGVRPDHYAPVGAALLWALEQRLGEDFTPETEAAWAAAYTTLSTVMIAAAYPAAA